MFIAEEFVEDQTAVVHEGVPKGLLQASNPSVAGGFGLQGFQATIVQTGTKLSVGKPRIDC